MLDQFEVQLGRNAYVTLAQVKDYLTITSNTSDARLTNVISYATSVVEHYIGQEILANNYIELFDGGTSSIFVSRLPLSNVYMVSEFNGSEHSVLSDPSTTGVPINNNKEMLSLQYVGDIKNSAKNKKFGTTSLKVGSSGYLISNQVPTDLRLEDSDFTIEMQIMVPDSYLSNATVFAINTDASNYMKLELSNQYGLAFTSNIAGVTTIITGANTAIEAQEFRKKQWSHIAITRDYINDRLYLFYNGNVIANSSFSTSNMTFTSNVEIAKTFSGNIDELRVSSIRRYSSNFTTPTNRFRPDEDTLALIHFDSSDNGQIATDVHGASADYNFNISTGEIMRYINSMSNYRISNKNSSLTLSGPPTFFPYNNGIRVEYRAGYESNAVPLDLQLATLDYIKILYKQDQDKKSTMFEGERGESYNLSSNFPPHIVKVLDMYRIIQ